MGVDGKCHAPPDIPPGKRPSSYCTGGWVGHRTVLEACGITRPHRDSTPNRPDHSESLYRLRCLRQRPITNIKLFGLPGVSSIYLPTGIMYECRCVTSAGRIIRMEEFTTSAV
jgi:hypothetical protein